jgi:hypothetical protein
MPMELMNKWMNACNSVQSLFWCLNNMLFSQESSLFPGRTSPPYASRNKMKVLVAIFFNFITNLMFTHCLIFLVSMISIGKKKNKMFIRSVSYLILHQHKGPWLLACEQWKVHCVLVFTYFGKQRSSLLTAQQTQTLIFISLHSIYCLLYLHVSATGCGHFQGATNFIDEYDIHCLWLYINDKMYMLVSICNVNIVMSVCN